MPDAEVLSLYCGIDVQKRVLYCVVRAFGYDIRGTASSCAAMKSSSDRRKGFICSPASSASTDVRL
jgi:hypothetical protein